MRHCTHCRLNVYNLSGMTGDEAERLVRTTEGRLCVRLYRRDDGTTITRDCPKGVRAAREKVARVFVLAASCVLSAIGCGSTAERLKADFGFSTSVSPVTAPIVMGKMAVTIPTVSTPAPTPKATVGARNPKSVAELGEVVCLPKKNGAKK